ncbi:hypothetical protein Tco_0382584 [Tanacetum coccineum]
MATGVPLVVIEVASRSGRADAVTLLKRIRKFSMAQDIGARAAVHIFNMISFAIAKGVGAQIVSRLPSNLLWAKRFSTYTEKEELKDYLDTVPGEEFAIDFESLATKFPIVDWKTYVLAENFMYYQIFRANGSSKNYKIFSEMLDDFER